MTKDEAMVAVQRAAFSASRRLLTGPTEEQWQAFGEAAAASIAALPDVLAAKYDPVSRTVLVTLTPAAMGFPVAVTLDGPKVTP